MKRTNKFYKTLSLSSPYQNESEIENNRNNPMLFKNDQDSINYSFNLMSEGDSSDKYTILLNHYFKLDIFNDNTWLFNQNPEFLKHHLKNITKGNFSQCNPTDNQRGTL